jgi:hypothetical protein
MAAVQELSSVLASGGLAALKKKPERPHKEPTLRSVKLDQITKEMDKFKKENPQLVAQNQKAPLQQVNQNAASKASSVAPKADPKTPQPAVSKTAPTTQQAPPKQSPKISLASKPKEDSPRVRDDTNVLMFQGAAPKELFSFMPGGPPPSSHVKEPVGPAPVTYDAEDPNKPKAANSTEVYRADGTRLYGLDAELERKVMNKKLY